MEYIDYSQYMLQSEAGMSDSDIPLVNPPNVCNLKAIFYTITPSDEYLDNIDKTVLTQSKDMYFRSDIIDQFRKLKRTLRRSKGFRLDFNIHFEKPVGGRIHAHGVIMGVPESYWDYEPLLKDMSKRFHKVFGKPRLRSDICALFKWTNDSWDGTYLVKQNYLRPVSLYSR